ncbi:MAG: DUF4422 domain-containing protein [Lactobacillaceae bacterium]|nr:DUF4422 domain-containing protein [Lactobacillaceae bacterium]
MKIIVAAHKPYALPDSQIYVPVQVGAALHEPIAGFLPDNSGQNISAKNPFYNELTALYWAKYNFADADVVGLAHYRRYLGKKASHDYQDLLQAADIEAALTNADIILPKQRNYFIENQEQHYLNAHPAGPYHVMEQIITEKYPEFIPAFEQTRKSKKAHLFNMSIMKQAQFQAYTDFLFEVLTEVDRRVDFAQMTGEDRRSIGFLGERLMDVWLYGTHQKFVEFPILSPENTNWLLKGYYFLRRHLVKDGFNKTHF